MLSRIKQLISLLKDFQTIWGSFKANVEKIKSFLIKDILKHPKNYIIGGLAIICLGLGAYFILSLFHKDITLTTNTYPYPVEIKGTSVVIKAPITGKITRLNTQLQYLMIHPLESVKILKGEVVITFDSSQLDKDLEKARSEKLEIGGKKTAVTEEVTESPDEVGLSDLQSQVTDLQIQKDSISLALQKAEAELAQAQELFTNKVVTQSFLDSAQFKYTNALTSRNLLDSKIENLENLYRRKSKLITKNRIIIRSEKDITDSSSITNWIVDKNNDLDKLLLEKQKTIVILSSDTLITKVNVFTGKTVKKGDTLLEGIEAQNLTGNAKVKSSDIKLIKAKKVKVFYQNTVTLVKTQLIEYQVKGSSIIFKIPDTQLFNKNGKLIIERIMK